MFYKMRSIKQAFAAVVFSALSVGAALAAPVLSITGASTVAPTTSFVLSVAASDVSDLYAYQFDLKFDASKFQVNSVSEGGFLLAGGSTFFDGGIIDNTLGTISFVFDTLLGADPGVSGSGVLAEFNFTSLGIGSGTFELANVIALDSSLADISVGTQSLTVNSVPEPATLGIALAGLAAMMLVHRRRGRIAPRSGWQE